MAVSSNPAAFCVPVQCQALWRYARLVLLLPGAVPTAADPCRPAVPCVFRSFTLGWQRLGSSVPQNAPEQGDGGPYPTSVASTARAGVRRLARLRVAPERAPPQRQPHMCVYVLLSLPSCRARCGGRHDAHTAVYTQVLKAPKKRARRIRRALLARDDLVGAIAERGTLALVRRPRSWLSYDGAGHEIGAGVGVGERLALEAEPARASPSAHARHAPPAGRGAGGTRAPASEAVCTRLAACSPFARATGAVGVHRSALPHIF